MKYSVEDLIKKSEKLLADRSMWNSHWDDVLKFALPNHYVTNYRSPGDKTNINLYDNTCMMSNQLLAGSLHGLLFNPNSIWFELMTGNPEIDSNTSALRWLQQSSRTIIDVMNNTNFQTEIHSALLLLVAIGTSPFAIEEDDEFIAKFQALPIREVAIVENNKGLVNELYREFKWDARQIVQEYGKESVGEKVLKAYSDNRPEKFCLIHAVYPKMEDDNVQHNYISQTILKDQKISIREKGFFEFPFAVPRWEKEPGEDYGRSPGMIALPEAKTLNKMVEQMIIAAAKTIDPPVMLPDDGFVLPVRNKPGGQNFYRSGSQDRIEPIFKDVRIDYGFEMMKNRADRIREAYFVDQLQLGVGGPQMTATEVSQRTEEKMRLLAPMLGRLSHELLRPLIDRMFAICYRRGLIAPPPEIIKRVRGGNIDVKYTSLISIAQKMSEGQNIMRTLQSIAPLGEISPATWDNIDVDKTAKKISKIYGFPQDCMREEKEVEAIRQAQAQAQQEAVQQQEQMAQTENVSKLMQASKPTRAG